MLDEDKMRYYVENHGRECPACGSDEIDVGPVHLEDDLIVAYGICRGCGRKWRDLYDLIAVEEVGVDG